MHLKYKSGSSWVDYNLVVYPVGAYYFSSSSTSPATLFGGTWTAVTGRFLYMNAGTGTGGSNSHTHSLNNAYAMGSYDWSNSPNLQFGIKSASWNHWGILFEWTTTQIARYRTGDITSPQNGLPLGGSSDSSSNMPAYQTVYAWRRTA